VRQSNSREWAVTFTEMCGFVMSAIIGHSERGDYVNLRPTRIHTNEVFTLQLLLGGEVLKRTFLEAFARDLIQDIALAGPKKGRHFQR
jgi:hypothetical protein